MKRKEFSLIELLVVIAIVAILAGMLLPALTRARESAKMANCLSNARQIGASLSLYVQSSDDFYPPFAEDLHIGGDPIKEN